MRIAAVLLLALLAPQEKKSLEWKFEKGTTATFDLVQDAHVTMGDNTVMADQSFSWTVSLAFAGMDGDLASVKLTFIRASIKVTGMMALEYDSTKQMEPSGPLDGTMAALIGKSVTLKMEKRGRVRKIEGLKDIVDKALEEHESPNQILQSLAEGVFSDGYFREMFHVTWGVLPTQAVKAGDDWNYEGTLPVPLMGLLKMKHKFTWKEDRAAAKEALLSLDTKAEPIQSDEAPMGSGEVTDAGYKGEVVWSTEKGVPKSSKGTLTVDFSIQGQHCKSVTKFEMKPSAEPAKK